MRLSCVNKKASTESKRYNTSTFFIRRNPAPREKNCVPLTLEGQTFPLCKTHFLQDYSLGIQRRFAILPSLPTSLDLSLLSLSGYTWRYKKFQLRTQLSLNWFFLNTSQKFHSQKLSYPKLILSWTQLPQRDTSELSYPQLFLSWTLPGLLHYQLISWYAECNEFMRRGFVQL